jgi:hypothetical protein
MRTRSPLPTSSGSVAGKDLPLKVRTLKSVISRGLGRRAPASMRHSCDMSTKSRSTRGPRGTRGCTTNIPTHPSAIWIISSWCEWYMNVPAWRRVNS